MDLNVLLATIVVLHAMVPVRSKTIILEKHVLLVIHQLQQNPNRAQNAV
jgi:hypothetical protein